MCFGDFLLSDFFSALFVKFFVLIFQTALVCYCADEEMRMDRYAAKAFCEDRIGRIFGK